MEVVSEPVPALPKEFLGAGQVEVLHNDRDEARKIFAWPKKFLLDASADPKKFLNVRNRRRRVSFVKVKPLLNILKASEKICLQNIKEDQEVHLLKATSLARVLKNKGIFWSLKEPSYSQSH